MRQIYFKIVESEKNKVKTLFHGINRSRTLEKGKWIKAERKMVSDGKGTKYLSGLHILEDYDKTVKYLSKFKKTHNKKIIKCYAEGLRVKETNSDVYLADKIFLI